VPLIKYRSIDTKDLLVVKSHCTCINKDLLVVKSHCRCIIKDLLVVKSHCTCIYGQMLTCCSWIKHLSM